MTQRDGRFQLFGAVWFSGGSQKAHPRLINANQNVCRRRDCDLRYLLLEDAPNLDDWRESREIPEGRSGHDVSAELRTDQGRSGLT